MPISWKGAFFGQPNPTVHCHPAHHSRVNKIPPPAAHFPDPFVGLLPIITKPIEVLSDECPYIVAYWHCILVVEIYRVEHLSIDIQLKLTIGPITDSHGSRTPIPVEVIEGLLGQIVTPIDTVDDLRRSNLDFSSTRFHPFHERVCFASESDPQQTIQREGGVTDPCVTIVPIPPSAERLRQTACWRRDDRAGRFKGHELERQGRSVHHFAPATGVRTFR